MKRLLGLFLQCVVGAEMLILITAFPVLFKKLSFHFSDYLHAIYELNARIITFGDFMLADGINSVFPVIFYKYLNSMKMLGLGVVAAFVIAFLVSYLALLFFKNRIHILKNILEILEAIPDLMIILLLQFMVIYIYKQTGIKLAQVVTIREEAILLPVICLSVPISFYITKVIIHHIEEELDKHYVILAKAKGLKFSYILNVHVLRNIVDSLFGTSKTIFWSMLSTLLVIDYLFNMNGLLRVMLTAPDPFFIGCSLIFIPFFILFRLYEWVSFDRRKDVE
ncbi:ABC transporter permease subunit [Neobacillus sp. 19]|uniref:ABC transporter permease subunit n=1 Tax=Neobacillus sp. 19 TaxID=3394458 RepID=UPI003BF673CD